MSHETQISPLAGWLLLALVCLWVLTSTGYEALEFAHSVHWESTMGTVVAADADSRKHEVSYRYEVGGTRYEAERISFAQFQRKGVPRPECCKYEAGGQVTVFYNPMNPEKCVLERRLAPSGCLWFAVSLVGLSVVSKRLDSISEPTPS